MKAIFSVTLVLFLAASGFAQELVIGAPTVGGTGCPGKSGYFRATQGNGLVFLFDKYEIDGVNDLSFGRAACSIRVPIKIAEGFKLVIKEVSTEGVYNQAEGDVLTFNQDVGFVGQGTRNPIKKELSGSWNYLELNDFDADSNTQPVAESGCEGADKMLSINMVSFLKKKSFDASESFLGVYKTSFRITVESCAADKP